MYGLAVRWGETRTPRPESRVPYNVPNYEVNMKRTLLSFLVVMVLAGIPQKGAGQDFVTTAMSGLPTQTMRVEYSSPSKLRKLPNYQSLRGKFLGPRLQQLESTLGPDRNPRGRHRRLDDRVEAWR